MLLDQGAFWSLEILQNKQHLEDNIQTTAALNKAF